MSAPQHMEPLGTRRSLPGALGGARPEEHAIIPASAGARSLWGILSHESCAQNREGRAAGPVSGAGRPGSPVRPLPPPPRRPSKSGCVVPSRSSPGASQQKAEPPGDSGRRGSDTRAETVSRESHPRRDRGPPRSCGLSETPPVTSSLRGLLSLKTREDFPEDAI